MLYSIPLIIHIDVLLCLPNTKHYHMCNTDLVLELVMSLDCDVGIHLGLLQMFCYILTTRFTRRENRRGQFNKRTNQLNSRHCSYSYNCRHPHFQIKEIALNNENECPSFKLTWILDSKTCFGDDFNTAATC